MIELQPVTKENFIDLLGLEVAEDQDDFVASNVFTLAEAYVALTTGEFVPMPYAIRQGDELVGFIGMAYVAAGLPSASGRTTGSYEIYRFMIDKRFQGKGLGRAALAAAIDLLTTQPLGAATHVETSFVPGNEVARHLYLSLGFEETGERDDDGELIAVLTF